MIEKKKYSMSNRFIQKFASTRFGAWFGSHLMHHFDRLFLKINKTRTLTSILSGLPIVILTTTGAKSGLPRTVPLVCIQQDNDTFAIIATNWGQSHYPAWYHNLKNNPQVTCSICGEVGEYTSHEAAGEEYDKFWNYAQNTYLGFSLYKQRVCQRHIPIMVMVHQSS
jgi:deazaflavin-dependent oxidoreductase (nitroreductase family)